MVAFNTLDQLYSRVHGGRPEADVLEHLVGALGLLLAGLAPRLTELPRPNTSKKRTT